MGIRRNPWVRYELQSQILAEARWENVLKVAAVKAAVKALKAGKI